MRSRYPEERPPLLAESRAPGRRPLQDEDPYQAWLWRCEIRATDDGLLAGKTVAFKDHIAVAGLPLTFGSYLMEDFRADFDATVVTRVLAAGGVIVGKNAMNGPTNSWGNGLPSDHLRPLNPHDPEHLTGGSSSGSAAAVAAREVDIAIGGDQGGSIRVPASYCGIYGLKPTFGLVSHFGVGFGHDQSLDFVGPMARYAEDVAACLDAIAGYDPLDPRQDRTVPVSVDSLSSLKGGVKGLRIGILEEGFDGAEAEVKDAVLSAIETLVSAGARATRVSVPEHQSAGLVGDILDVEGSRAVFDVGFLGAFAKTYYPLSLTAATYRLFHEHTQRLRPRDKLTLIVSEVVRTRFQGTTYAKAQNVRNGFRRAFDRAFHEIDVLVMPTCLTTAPRYVDPGSDLSAAFQPRRRIVNAQPFNYTGHPALSVPCGKSRGLPIGMQLVGRYYEDQTLLRAAFAFEQSVEWERIIDVPGRQARHGAEPTD